MTLRAVHIERDDAEARFGGDVVHLRALVAALVAEGVDAVATTWDGAPDDVDVVHLWNVDLPFLVRDHARSARARWPGAAVVVTPIFWPWPPLTLARARDPAIWHRATRNAAKAWVSWRAVRGALRDVDAVFTCSARERTLLGRYYRLRPTPAWTVATTGVWAREWPPRHGSTDRAGLAAECGFADVPGRIVACAGRLEPLKNQRTLVRAVAAVPDAALVLVGAAGDHRYADGVLALAERLLPGRFAWLDRRPHDEVRRLLGAVDVHALLSYREVASLSSLEAAAAGCEIVVGDWSSAEEYFGSRAHRCDVASAASAAAAIERAATSPAQPALRDDVLSRFDWSVPAVAVAARYRQLVGTDKGRS